MLINGLVSDDMHDEVLLSWHDMVGLGILSPQFPHVDPRRPLPPTKAAKTEAVPRPHTPGVFLPLLTLMHSMCLRISRR
jgi:hypothetical protein